MPSSQSEFDAPVLLENGKRVAGSSDDEQFSDALDGEDPDGRSIPTTRVEKVDDQPSHGEVPGTAAYDMRKQDAVPDEIEVISEDLHGRASTSGSSEGGMDTPIPKTIVEKIDPAIPSHGEVPGTAAHELRKADAEPDAVVNAPDVARAAITGLPTSATNRYPVLDFRSSPLENNRDEDSGIMLSENEDDGVVDDFDEFEDGDGTDDFGAFNDVDIPQVDEDIPAISTKASSKPEDGAPPKQLPLFSFDNLNTEEDITAACQPYLRQLFPHMLEGNTAHDPILPEVDGSLLTERSQSLWAQLVAPPPLQPPNWVRSRIRRSFLVSLGVPVDLDEILPASKQKKLILPSLDTEDDPHRVAHDAPRTNGSVARLAQANNSSTSVASTPAKSERKRRGPPSPPGLDLISTRRLCSTTSTALKNMTVTELRSHISQLEMLKHRASEVLEYWLIRRDSATGDKEAFEEVIENLVKHAKKIRK